MIPIKTQNQKKRQNRPSEIRLSGVPPIMPIKTQNKKKTKGKIDPPKYVYKLRGHKNKNEKKEDYIG